MGLRDSKQVARIVIDPIDHDIVYVAALGDLWKGGGKRGICPSIDGGGTWTRVLDAGPHAGGPALGLDPPHQKTHEPPTHRRRRPRRGRTGGGDGRSTRRAPRVGRTSSSSGRRYCDRVRGFQGLSVIHASA